MIKIQCVFGVSMSMTSLLYSVGCISPLATLDVEQNDTAIINKDSGAYGDSGDTEGNVTNPESEPYGLAVTHGRHVVLNGKHTIVREYSEAEEEFTNLLDWNSQWGFSVSMGPINEDNLEYMTGFEDEDGEVMPLFLSEGRMVALQFKSLASDSCDSGWSVYPTLFVSHSENGSQCLSDVIENRISDSKAFCKDRSAEERQDVETRQTYKDVLDGGYNVTVLFSNNRMKLWLNDFEILNEEYFPTMLNGTCSSSFNSDGTEPRTLYFGKGDTLLDGTTIPHVQSRVDNIVIFSSGIDEERLPEEFSVWDVGTEPHEVFKYANVGTGPDDGFGWWTFESVTLSPHDTIPEDEPQHVLDFSPYRPFGNNLMRIMEITENNDTTTAYNVWELYYDENGDEIDG